jgi:hypothetical protein
MTLISLIIISVPGHSYEITDEGIQVKVRKESK